MSYLFTSEYGLDPGQIGSDEQASARLNLPG